jgi:hypothetical protein
MEKRKGECVSRSVNSKNQSVCLFNDMLAICRSEDIHVPISVTFNSRRSLWHSLPHNTDFFLFSSAKTSTLLYWMFPT